MHSAIKHCIVGFLLIMGLLLFTTEVIPSQIGIMVMHGKGGMPWSKERHYDVSVDEARKEIKPHFKSCVTKGRSKCLSQDTVRDAWRP